MKKILDSKSFKATADNFRGGGGYYRKFKLFVCVMTFLNKTIKNEYRKLIRVLNKVGKISNTV